MAKGAPFCLVILTEAQGSAPQESGAKMLCDGNGLIAGTIGGGKVEAKALGLARELIERKTATHSVEWHLQKDVGMTCGGRVRLYFETYSASDWHIVVFGAGHVAQALIRTLLTLDCRITCVDPRADWLAQLPESPQLVKQQANEPQKIVHALDAQSYVALMTQGHATDFPVLLEAMRRAEPFRYLGVIGSKSKRKTLVGELLAAGVAADKAERFFCPIGLPLGRSIPEEIAISIAAQLLQIRDAGA